MREGPLRWDGSRFRGFAWEIGSGPSGALDIRGGYRIGGVLALRLYHRRRYSSRSPISGAGFLAVIMAAASGGLLALPYQAWLGNERGVDLRVRGSIGQTAEHWGYGLSVGLAPHFRLATKNSRLRFPSVVGFLLPEVGYRHLSGGIDSLYLKLHRFTFGVLLGWRVALELEPGMLLHIPMKKEGRTTLEARLDLMLVFR